MTTQGFFELDAWRLPILLTHPSLKRNVFVGVKVTMTGEFKYRRVQGGILPGSYRELLTSLIVVEGRLFKPIYVTLLKWRESNSHSGDQNPVS